MDSENPQQLSVVLEQIPHERTPSSPDAVRSTEPWTRSLEELLRSWCKIWRIRGDLHLQQSEIYSKWQTGLAIPCVALPLIFAPVSSGFSAHDCNDAALRAKDLSLAVGFIACSVTAAFNAFFRWGETSIKHMDAGRHYMKLVSDAEEILAMERRHRPEAVLAMRTLKIGSDSILRVSPLIPITLKQKHHLSTTYEEV